MYNTGFQLCTIGSLSAQLLAFPPGTWRDYRGKLVETKDQRND